MVGDPGKLCCLLDLIGLAKYSAAALYKPGRVKQAAVFEFEFRLALHELHDIRSQMTTRTWSSGRTKRCRTRREIRRRTPRRSCDGPATLTGSTPPWSAITWPRRCPDEIILSKWPIRVEGGNVIYRMFGDHYKLFLSVRQKNLHDHQQGSNLGRLWLSWREAATLPTGPPNHCVLNW